MNNILITGQNSYVGTETETYLRRHGFHVETLDMLGDGWKNFDFSGFDAVFHVAGIVHLTGEAAAKAEQLYHQVNTDLAIETAKKAKAAGVKQFLFMSTASVYGETGKVGLPKVIDQHTPLNPANAYGLSKLNAEKGLAELSCDTFKVCILRPPMIYGKGCKGNYQTLRKLALKLPLFPKVENQRSMIYMGNLAEFVRLMIVNQEQGIFCPQDDSYVSTCDMVRLIAKYNGKSIAMLPGLTWAVKLLGSVTDLANKAFGNLCYARELSDYKENYCPASLEQAIRETEA